ncbi:MAG: thiamine phosphate synthase, partial [Candidatus Sulfotelmatobacter sp.]
KIAEAASAGIDYIQLREKDLSTRDLESLAREAVQIIRDHNNRRTENREPRTALLINSRTDVALAIEADGVHLPTNNLSPNEIRQIWRRGAGALAREISPPNPLISISCHSPEEVTQAAIDAATLAIFAPVFEKKDAPGNAPTGLEALREACQAKIPVLALGGITLQNAASCLQAGAAGIAAIRLFQENSIADIARTLREINHLGDFPDW